MDHLTDEEAYWEARKRMKKKKGFYKHLSTYLVVGSFFFLLNMADNPRDIWFIFPMLTWGVGLGIHYVSVFGLPGFNFNSKEWEEEQIRREMRNISRELPEAPAFPQHKDDANMEELRLPPLREKEANKSKRNYRDDDFV